MEIMTDSNKTPDTMAVCWKSVGEKRLYGIGTCSKLIVSHGFFWLLLLFCSMTTQLYKLCTLILKQNALNSTSQIDTTNTRQHQRSNICRFFSLVIHEFPLVCAHKNLFVLVSFLLWVFFFSSLSCLWLLLLLFHLLRSIRSVSWVRVRTPHTCIIRAMCCVVVWCDVMEETKWKGTTKQNINNREFCENVMINHEQFLFISCCFFFFTSQLLYMSLALSLSPSPLYLCILNIQIHIGRL